MTKDTVNIHGKQYETVASRVQRFREKWGSQMAIETELISADTDRVVMKALIREVSEINQVIATGYAEESRTSSSINRTSALENAETSAIGRALAAFGMAGTEYASADEVTAALTQQTVGTVKKVFTPKTETKKFDKPLTGEATDVQKDTIHKSLQKLGIPDEDQKGYLIEQYGAEFPLTKEMASFVISDLFEQNSYARK